MYSFPNLEPVHCSISGSNCCFLTCMQISQEAGEVFWYSLLFKNFPQFVVIHTVNGFGIVNKAEADVFLELSCIYDDPTDVGNLISGSSDFSKSSLNIWKFTVHVLGVLELGDHHITTSQGRWDEKKISLEKISFHSNAKERQCQRMLKLLRNCTHLTRCCCCCY